MLRNIQTIKITATPLIMIKLSWVVNISINISLHLQYICILYRLFEDSKHYVLVVLKLNRRVVNPVPDDNCYKIVYNHPVTVRCGVETAGNQ